MLKNQYIIATIIAVVATALTFLMGLLFGWVTPETINGFEVAAAATSYACTYLFIVQKRAAYLIGMVTTALYVVVFLQANLIGSAVLNAYLVITLIYGFFVWGKDENTKPLQHQKWKTLPLYILATVVLFAGAFGLVTLFGGSFAPADSIILVFTILAQLMTDRKVIESWLVWVIGVNIAGVLVYASAGLPFVAVQQFIFGVASAVTFFVWLREYNRNKREASISAHPAGSALPATA